jgi:hypothetical protein
MTGRIRTIKPQAHVDEDLWDADVAHPDLHLFRAFTGLWCQADREGRFEWRPRELKAAILPHWNGDFSRVLDVLATCGFLVKYTSDSREYGCVRTFKQHQFINGKEPASKLPPPPSETVGKTKGSRKSNKETSPHSEPEKPRVAHVSSTGEERDEDAPIHIPSSSSSLPVPLPVPEGGAGGEGSVAPRTEPEAAPLVGPEVRFRMHRDWGPNPDSVAAVRTATLGSVTDGALQVFTGEFVGHFGQQAKEVCTDGEWNQRWQKWVQRGWSDPKKRPKAPSESLGLPESAQPAGDGSHPTIDRLFARGARELSK